MYKELQVEGYLVDYERVPITDEKSPKEQDFDILVSSGVIIFQKCYLLWTDVVWKYYGRNVTNYRRVGYKSEERERKKKLLTKCKASLLPFFPSPVSDVVLQMCVCTFKHFS